jgi:hypothetical protein
VSTRAKLAIFGSRSCALALLVAVALAGCAVDRTGPLGPGGPPVLSFVYGGPVSGVWRAEGAVQPTFAAGTPWAAARWYEGDLIVAAQRSNDDGSVDWVGLAAPLSAPGVVRFDGECYESVGCPRATLAFGLGNGPRGAAELSCSLHRGTLHLTSLTQTRVRGTFEGTGVCFTPQGVRFHDLTITGGWFDVPFR